MQSSPKMVKERKFRYGWLIASLLLLGATGLFFFSKTIHPSQFGKIWQVYSFKPEVTATAYESRNGNATIIWLSGIDEHLSEFGQIWQVYSFKPDITATAYDSPKGDATIIWVSGMDDEGDSDGKTSS